MGLIRQWYQINFQNYNFITRIGNDGTSFVIYFCKKNQLLCFLKMEKMPKIVLPISLQYDISID